MRWVGGRSGRCSGRSRGWVSFPAAPPPPRAAATARLPGAAMQPRQADACIPLQPPKQGRPHAAGPDGGPRDFILWSLFNALLGQGFSYLGCLCFPALIFSIKARDRKVLGDLEAARRYGARAKALNIISSLLLAGAMVAIIIIVVWR